MKMEKYQLTASLRPALAGLVIDHEAGEKEAYAAFVDLVVRGHVSPVMSGGKKAFAIAKNANGELHEHEKAVLEAVFQSKKPEVAYADAAAALGMIGTDEKFQQALANDAVLQGLYVKREKPADLKEIYRAIEEKYAGQARLVVFGFFLGFPLLCVLAFAMFFFTTGLTVFFGMSLFTAWAANSFCCIILPFALYLLSIGSIINKAINEKSAFEKKFLPELSTNLGSAQRKKYAELRDWLSTRPLHEMRWSNEFLGYAVAFGLIKNYREFPK